MTIDVDDPVVEEHDIFVSTQLSSYLNILQFSGNMAEVEGNATAMTGRVKKSHRILELEVPLDSTHPTYSLERGKELASYSQAGRIRVQGDTPSLYNDGTKQGKLDTVQLTGAKLRMSNDSRYFVGVFSNGIICLSTPSD